MELSYDWREVFGHGDLARGEDYYYNGAVFSLRQVSNGWTAKVGGSLTYNTFVPSESGGPQEMTCDCPRFEDGYYCKHLAATCLAIESGDAAHDASLAANDDDIAKLVASVAEQEVRSFLLDVLLHDDMVATRFVRRYGAVDARTACQELAEQLRAAAWEYSDGGFIDWRSALGFEHRYREIVHTSIDPLVQRGDYNSSLDLSIQALRSLQRIQIDDSEGFFSGVINDVEGMWERWLGVSDEFDSLLFERISDYLLTPPQDDEEYEIYSYAADMARDFQVERFVDHAEFSERFIALANDELESVRESYDEVLSRLSKVREDLAAADVPRGRAYTECKGRMLQLERERNGLEFHARAYDQHLARWALIRTRALRASGASEGMLRAEAEPYMAYDNVCLYLVEVALEHHDVEGALGLLRDSKDRQRTRGDGSYSPKVSERMVELLWSGDVDSLRGELVHLLCCAPYVGQTHHTRELWARLRQSYDEPTWIAERESVLDRVANMSTRRECLAAEGLYDRLMDEIEEDGFFALSHFEGELVAHCPERVLKLHLDELANNRLYPGNDRKSYRRFAQRLLHVKSLPGGEGPVAALVRLVRERYPRRPALMDELRVVMG